ncbi:serine/threonine protein kinase [Coprinopsis marcescibilis]|uniref:Serine/threonine protein kinase n=1 Tax=Coprinopsis marcescibilis TaxID=230819 RepID=A0A5C3L2L1_COPMA|nr:serine/threonine protein kinase [Coprinopsis marcescibilis]
MRRVQIIEQAASWPASSFGSRVGRPDFLAVIWMDRTTGVLNASRLTGRRINEFTDEDLEERHVPIPPQHYQPRWDPYISLYSVHIPQTERMLYFKKPRLIGYDGTTRLAQKLRQEISVLEELRKNSHPNLCEYFGCFGDTNTGLIIGLPPLNFELIRQGLAAGIKHLHALGLAHNDISPTNIMIDEYGNPIIIDFDNCCPFGQPCRTGTPNFTNLSRISDKANDVFAYNAVMSLLHEKLGQPTSSAPLYQVQQTQLSAQPVSQVPVIQAPQPHRGILT